MRTCLGSGRVQIASRSVVGRCEINATGVVHLVMLTPLLGMTKGKDPKGPPGSCSSERTQFCAAHDELSAACCAASWGHSQGRGGKLPLPLFWMLTSPLRIWSRHSSSSKMS